LKLIAIDRWEDTPCVGYDGPGEFAEVIELAGGLWEAFKSGMRTHARDVLSRTVIKRGMSLEMLESLPDQSCDSIFLDDAHDGITVSAEITIAKSKLKPGGILCGHDFSPKFPGVISAVEEAFPGTFMRHPGSCWYWEKQA
jgi:hypothetical protein